MWTLDLIAIENPHIRVILALKIAIVSCTLFLHLFISALKCKILWHLSSYKQKVFWSYKAKIKKQQGRLIWGKWCDFGQLFVFSNNIIIHQEDRSCTTQSGLTGLVPKNRLSFVYDPTQNQNQPIFLWLKFRNPSSLSLVYVRLGIIVTKMNQLP